jgi:hypothetical protein
VGDHGAREERQSYLAEPGEKSKGQMELIERESEIARVNFCESQAGKEAHQSPPLNKPAEDKVYQRQRSKSPIQPRNGTPSPQKGPEERSSKTEHMVREVLSDLRTAKEL